MTPQWDNHFSPHYKLNTLYLHLLETYRHQIRQGVALLWEAPILKGTWPFDYVTNMTSPDKLKNLYFCFQKRKYKLLLWLLHLGASLRKDIQHANAKFVTNFLLNLYWEYFGFYLKASHTTVVSSISNQCWEDYIIRN